MPGDLNPTKDTLVELLPWQADWIPPVTLPYQSYIGKSSDAVQSGKTPITKVQRYGAAPFSVGGYAEYSVGCKIFIDINLGKLTSVGITAPGSGYTSAPTVSFTGGGGTGAAAVAIINSAGQVVYIAITNQGTGYTSAPTVAFAGGAGTGAAATAFINEYSTVTDYPMFQYPQIKVRLSPLGNGVGTKKPYFFGTAVVETLAMDMPVAGLLGFTFQAQGSGASTLGAY